MATTMFSHSLRVLVCGSCGAPFDVPPAGGSVTCSYCRAVSSFHSRDERADIAAARSKGPINEPERFARLRQQDGKPLMPPPALQHYLLQGSIAPQLVGQGQAEWQATVAELRAGAPFGTEERLYFLTMMLAGYYAAQQDERRARALQETALELMQTPRHKQVIRCMLARSAARGGDLQSAEQWLQPCDPYSDDIHMDTAYRFSRAYIHTVKGEWQGVLQQLGPRIDDVPLADGQDEICALLRSNAHERLGNQQLAVEQLVTAMSRSPGGRLIYDRCREANRTISLCPYSYETAASQIKPPAAALAGGGAKVRNPCGFIFILIPIGFFIAAVFTPEGAKTDDGYPLNYFFVFMGCCFLIGPGILLLLGLLNRRKQRYFAEHGIPGSGQILAVQETGMRVNNQPQVAMTLLVTVPGRAPYQVVHKQVVSYVELPRLQPGTQLNLKADPKKPDRIMLG